jgi:transcriptional regulator with XRE-family HTH domain
MRKKKRGGHELTKIRKRLGLTQGALAERLGISRVYISQMESGEKPLNAAAEGFVTSNKISPENRLREKTTANHTRHERTEKISPGNVTDCNPCRDISESNEPKEDVERGSFKCPWCGRQTKGALRYYSHLTSSIVERLIKLATESTWPDYVAGVLDALHQVLGDSNLVLIDALRKNDLWNDYKTRYLVAGTIEGKTKCGQCGHYFPDEDITIDCPTPYRSIYICGRCDEKNKTAKAEHLLG